MKIQHLPVPRVFETLRSGAEGLSPAEAARRFAEVGPNRIEREEREPLLLRFAHGFTHLFALILWVAAALAFFAEWRGPGQGMAVLGWAIIGVILINGVFSFWQEYRAERALDALERLLPHEARVVREGSVAVVPVATLVPGDLVLLEEGDAVPADCRLIEAQGVRVSDATLTGESRPRSRDARPCVEEHPSASRNLVLAGTSVVAGRARAVVYAIGKHTEFGKIARLTQSTRETVSPLQKEIARLSRLIAILAAVLGIGFFFIGRSMGLPLWASLMFGIGIIVANVPEGLLPTVTLALAMGSQRMARRNALVRHLPAVETLGSATVICTDKTGTLTENRMTVRRLYAGERFFEWDPHGQPGASEVTPTPPIPPILIQGMRLCHDLKAGRNGELMGDPMEIALVEAAGALAPATAEPERAGEVPFDAERRRMSTIHRLAGGGMILHMKGAPEQVIALCAHIEAPDGPRPLTDAERQALLDVLQTMAGNGLRVLAFAFRRLPEGAAMDRLERDLTLSGLVGLQDPPRPEVPAAIRSCREAGIKVIMVTGDHPQTALAIARRIGLVTTPSATVWTGEAMRHLSEAELQLALDAPEILFARVEPEQKMRIVAALQDKQQIVAVTGDGVNDAPALKRADIGIAMGRSGTDVAREAADIVLLDDNFASIVAAIEEGRAVYANIRKFLTYILTSNVPELIPYLAFVLFRIPLPLTLIQILAVDLGTDMVPALALGAEAPDPGVMRRPPRPAQQRLLDRGLLLRAYLLLGPIEAAAAMAAFFIVLRAAGWRYGAPLGLKDPVYLQATTACLTAIVVMQVANLFVCRSERRSAFASGLLNNPLLFAGILVEGALILLIDYTPSGNRLFGTSPLPGWAWWLPVPFAFGMIAVEELRKAIVRRHGATSPG
jgi:calcium-translocating P-type ATPase